MSHSWTIRGHLGLSASLKSKLRLGTLPSRLSPENGGQKRQDLTKRDRLSPVFQDLTDLKLKKQDLTKLGQYKTELKLFYL